MSNSTSTLKEHYARALDLLKEKAALSADFVQWRDQARNDGLDPRAIIKLARESLLDAEQRRKAAERAEIEEVYRQGLDLPLFADLARAAE